ncbi:glycosyl hydrolase [Oleiharenicola lentus]|uniref:glycosyl hydrolase n=1 Tax=Oleiharenicola lentus TaxID=2508720 RepID=UPI003F66DE7F
MKFVSDLCAIGLLAIFSVFGTHGLRADELEKRFLAPPPEARPWVFWYWMHGAISKEGITADLEAMKTAGIAGAYLMPIKDVEKPELFPNPVRTLTPQWWAMLKHAMTEADRLGLQFGLHVCDGFATAGGPWITRELSMQKVVWSETFVTGGAESSVILPKPPTKENYYRDIAVLAWPAGEETIQTTRTVVPKITTDFPGVDAQFLVEPVSQKQIRADQPGSITYEFAEAFTARSLVIKNWTPNYGGVYQATRLKVAVSDDGVAFRELLKLEPPRHGWQDWAEDYTFSLPETKARFFSFSFDPEGSEKGAEDLDGAKWRARLILRGLELSSEARIGNFEGKSGAVWRRSAPVSAQVLPDARCVPVSDIIDVTAQMDAAGRLNWKPPQPGRWRVLRVGHTSTGKYNETAGAGKGREADKFSAAAVTLQFDKWFAETVRRVGPELASRVLKVFHTDSWEAGGQNWTGEFAREFKTRRGYALTKWLPLFAGIPIGSAADSERVLADVRLTISDLVDEKFFGTLAALAKTQGCEFSAEATAPTMTGDGMRHYGRVDLPMGEFWHRSPTHDKPNDMLDAISGAHIYGKNIIGAEAFTELRMRWDEHPGMLKPLADRHFALGMNRVVFHVFAHNPWLDRRPGMTLDGVGIYFQRDQTWWHEAKAWTDYIARCSALLQAGRPVIDVAYFAGETLPSRAILPEQRSVALPAGYAADSINRDALLRLARVKEGRLVLPGGASYAALVLPKGETPSEVLAAKLAQFSKQGLVVVKPGEASLNRVLDARGVTPDLLATDVVGAAIEGIDWAHRSADGAEIYFVSNQLNEARAVSLSMRANERVAEIWNPVTGEMTQPNESSEAGGRVDVTLQLEQYGARFVILRERNDQTNRAVAKPVSPKVLKEIPSPWRVEFDVSPGGFKQRVAFDALTDWSKQADAAIRFYSGTARYTQVFQIDAHAGRVWLDLGRVENLARVKVNDLDCGVAWTAPYRVEITHALRPGANVVEIAVTNTWANRLNGDQQTFEIERVTQTTAPIRLERDKLLPAGLLGPVTLQVER